MPISWTDTRPLNSLLPAKEARAIKKHLGYSTANELLGHLPRSFATRHSPMSMDSLTEGDIVTCIGVIQSVSVNDTGRTFVLTATIYDGQRQITAVFFRVRWLQKVLHEGVVALFTGKLKYFRGEAQLQHPDYVILDKAALTSDPDSDTVYDDEGDCSRYIAHLETIPIYPATKNLPTWRIAAAIAEVLRRTPHISDPLAAYIPPGFPSLDAAIRGLHQDPQTKPSYYRDRLAFDEALALATVMATRRQESRARLAPRLEHIPNASAAQLIVSLPYALTDGQRSVIADIAADLTLEHPMQRLLQGEVGSGKTVVSLVAMLQAIDNGKQCALLAPTEVLAHQHARSLKDLLDLAGLDDIAVTVLSSGMPIAQRRQALLDCVSGQADIVVGTHALIQESVEFFDLGFCVVDEQHRFGVEQRDALRSKGKNGLTPHLLVMTATPIPRTVAMTHFGDLSSSVLRELPQGRKPIKSFCVPTWLEAWTKRMWEVVREQIASGHQVYVVCPRVHKEGGVLETHAQLSSHQLSDFTVECLYGSLAPRDKDDIMKRFAQGDIDALVSTTVIEVGIDVANATVMIVLEADHFGASQLHQLRGRVGRGGNASHCFFVTEAEQESASFMRIKQLSETTDGFEVADLDLSMRREGDVLGSAQSGTRRAVRYLDLLHHAHLIEHANARARDLVEENPRLAQLLTSRYTEHDRYYLEKS
ncbi:ATP-dependent DNA helicase RecG [Corynebacterium sp. ES2715-CONJ3]|uniref:ATP-dependent DNA helicase RecG n=1 Tax=Corynebacterium sp. ES2715-CONJ3 TaxID=2974028 RepID=UPI0037C1146E|nr:ATP-dependent DNA helicase RecG [Corynebacterium sp. ES2715-CONJ3]